MHNGDWDNGMDGGGWWWIPMMIMMIAFWGGLIWLAVALIRRPNHTLHSVAPGLAAQPQLRLHACRPHRRSWASALLAGRSNPTITAGALMP